MTGAGIRAVFVVTARYAVLVGVKGTRQANGLSLNLQLKKIFGCTPAFNLIHMGIQKLDLLTLQFKSLPKEF